MKASHAATAAQFSELANGHDIAKKGGKMSRDKVPSVVSQDKPPANILL